MAGLTRTTGNSTSTWAVSCGWVPGTFDRVRVASTRADDAGEVVMPLDEIRSIAGREVVNELYLQGRASFSCDRNLWQYIRSFARRIAGQGR
jgi:hypothetical protein